MSTVPLSKSVVNSNLLSLHSSLRFYPFSPSKFSSHHQIPTPFVTAKRRRKREALTLTLVSSSSPELSAVDEEWLKKLPEKKKPLYSHSLPCIEAWLKKLGFRQSREDRAVWFIEKPDWHAQLSLDVTDLYIRYLKSGPGDLDKDVERRFSYALSREDIENAILGGP